MGKVTKHRPMPYDILMHSVSVAVIYETTGETGVEIITETGVEISTETGVKISTKTGIEIGTETGDDQSDNAEASPSRM